MTRTERTCPCGIGFDFDAHCGTVHRKGAGFGQTAEALMRARYSAYVLGNADFLLDSWHETTRPTTVAFDDDIEWRGLDIVGSSAGTGFDNQGTVEFRARFRRGGQHLELHENSAFVRVDGRWTYLGPVE